MDNTRSFNVDIPPEKPINPEDLVKETENFVKKTRLTQDIVKQVEFRQKVAKHQKQHPCCLYPEICVVAEGLPKDRPIRIG